MNNQARFFVLTLFLALSAAHAADDMHAAEKQSKQANVAYGGTSAESAYIKTLEKLNACLEEKQALQSRAKKVPYSLMVRADFIRWDHFSTDQFNVDKGKRNCEAKLAAACAGQLSGVQFIGSSKTDTTTDYICSALCTPN